MSSFVATSTDEASLFSRADSFAANSSPSVIFYFEAFLVAFFAFFLVKSAFLRIK